MSTSNCKGCTKRKPGCHDNCAVYKTWKADLTNKKKVLAASNECDRFIKETARRWFKK